MAHSQEHNENRVDSGTTRPTSNSEAPDRVLARVSADGLSVEVVRYVGAELVELRCFDPVHAMNYAAQLGDAAAVVLRNRARLGIFAVFGALR